MPTPPRRRTLVLAALTALLLLALPAAAQAWPAHYPRIAGNPADRLLRLPLEPSTYDAARRCTPRPKPGMLALVDWLERTVEGSSWGTYRCERWGRDSASLHAEGRAVDWHLDVSRPADRREATRLIGLLLAPDRAGNPHALARRMGVEEIIWDCGYWAAGMERHSPYSPCFARSGRPRRRLDKTLAHRDHVHIGMTRAGAAERTSFWTTRSVAARGTSAQR